MNPNLLLGGLLVGGGIAAGAAMFLNGDFSPKPETEVASASESRAPKLAVKTPGALSQFFSPSLMGNDRPITDPNKTVRTESYGYEIRHPGMLSDAGSLHLAQDVLIGLPKGPYGVPGTAERIEASETCEPPAVPANAEFVNVHVGQAQLDGPFKLYSNARMAQIVGDWIGQKKLGSRYAGDAPKPADPTSMVNVVITDTGGPVYLVLQGANEPITWNLQTAQNVEIAEIVLIGHPGQSVVPPKTDLPVSITALTISKDCAPAPWRAPGDHWGIVDGVLSEHTVNKYVAEAIGRYQRYDRWFEKSFGRPSEDGVVGAWTASNILIGPVPQAGEVVGQAYVPMTDRTAYITPTDNFFLSTGDEARALEAAAHLELATRAVGGDLALLTPEPMERSQ